jgi:hypothetical protein
MRALIFAALVAAVPACASSGAPDDGSDDVDGSEPVAIAKGFAAIDLISPATCQLKNGKLRQCVIAPATHVSPPFDAAVPLRTVVRRVQQGTCSTQYPLRVAIALDGGAETMFGILADPPLTLRASGGGVVGQVAVHDASTWTPYAIFDGSCRIALEITSNEVDVDTVQQAEGILAAIDQELAAAQTDQRNYEALLALQAAYAFTHAVAASFHAELTSDTMQELRQAALDAAPSLETAVMGCGDALSEAQRDTLFQLYVTMVALGDPASWQNPDGSTKTLEQFYGPGAAAVLAQLEALGDNANPDLETQYRNGLQAAAAEVARLTQKRALAVQQLAPWLGGAP